MAERFSTVQRMWVWDKYMKGRTSGKCCACGMVTIHVKNFHLGHDKPKSKGGTYDLDNLRPVCSTCNLEMGNRMTIQQFKAKHFPATRKAQEATVATKGKTISQRELKGKVQSQVRRLGYGLSANKYGFDVCGVSSPPIGLTKYLVVGCNSNETVSENYVRPFMKKVSSFAQRQGPLSDVRGLIAYTGKPIVGAKALVKGQKPPIKFQKFQ